MEFVYATRYFGAVDLIVFTGLLLLAIAIGIYYAVKDRRKNDTDTYYFGGKTMSPIPVGLSIAVTFISAITVIGFPTEAYGYGTIIMLFTVSGFLPNIVACIYYIPLIHRLSLSSIFEYLELRFHRNIRLMQSFLAVVTTIMYLGSTIYLPALALNAVTPMSLKWTITITSIVAIFYTTLGGMKAVVWTDTVQTFIMFFGMLAAFIKSIVAVGGVHNVIQALERGERQTIFKFIAKPGDDNDPVKSPSRGKFVYCLANILLMAYQASRYKNSVVRTCFTADMTLPYTFWSMIAGYAFMACGSTCVNQSISQRYLSCKSVKDARIAALVSLIPAFVFFFLASGSGCAMYAYFEGCDPLKAGVISKPDQLMPLFILQIFADYPGMAGLFVSAAFSGTLSTVSSGINAAGALILEDFILPAWPKLSTTWQIIISKIIVTICGLLSMCYAFCIEHIGATIMQIGYIVVGTLVGPVLGVFTLGIFLPWCNTKGVAAGQIISTITMGWIAVSGFVYGKTPEKYAFLPTSVDQCGSENTTVWSNSTQYTSSIELSTRSHVTSTTVEARTAIQDTLFEISHQYYAMMSFIITVVVALPVSLLTGPNKPESMDPKLFLPFVDHKCLPNKVRSFFRFGVPLNEKKWEPRKYEEAPEEKSDLIVYSYSEPAMAVDMKASVV